MGDQSGNAASTINRGICIKVKAHQKCEVDSLHEVINDNDKQD